VSNSVAAGRQLARRAVLFQGVAVLVTALACLFLGWKAALAALLGGGALLVGGAVAAWLVLSGGVASAGVVMTRMFTGLVLKWVVVFAALLLGLVAWRLPALPLLLGLLAALIAQFIAAATRR
jgi:F0F1-type ATP synthase assembly protein I